MGAGVAPAGPTPAARLARRQGPDRSSPHIAGYRRPSPRWAAPGPARGTGRTRSAFEPGRGGARSGRSPWPSTAPSGRVPRGSAPGRPPSGVAPDPPPHRQRPGRPGPFGARPAVSMELFDRGPHRLRDRPLAEHAFARGPRPSGWRSPAGRVGAGVAHRAGAIHRQVWSRPTPSGRHGQPGARRLRVVLVVVGVELLGRRRRPDADGAARRSSAEHDPRRPDHHHWRSRVPATCWPREPGGGAGRRADRGAGDYTVLVLSEADSPTALPAPGPPSLLIGTTLRPGPATASRSPGDAVPPPMAGPRRSARRSASWAPKDTVR